MADEQDLQITPQPPVVSNLSMQWIMKVEYTKCQQERNEFGVALSDEVTINRMKKVAIEHARQQQTEFDVDRAYAAAKGNFAKFRKQSLSIIEVPTTGMITETPEWFYRIRDTATLNCDTATLNCDIIILVDGDYLPSIALEALRILSRVPYAIPTVVYTNEARKIGTAAAANLCVLEVPILKHAAEERMKIDLLTKVLDKTTQERQTAFPKLHFSHCVNCQVYIFSRDSSVSTFVQLLQHPNVTHIAT